MIGYAYQPITAYDIVTNRMEKAFHDVIRDLVGESFCVYYWYQFVYGGRIWKIRIAKG